MIPSLSKRKNGPAAGRLRRWLRRTRPVRVDTITRTRRTPPTAASRRRAAAAPAPGRRRSAASGGSGRPSGRRPQVPPSPPRSRTADARISRFFPLDIQAADPESPRTRRRSGWAGWSLRAHERVYVCVYVCPTACTAMQPRARK